MNVFYALRETNQYIEKIRSLDKRDEDILVSIIGGMGFLHILDLNQFKKIYLVDKSENQIEYCKTIIDIIINSENIEEFRSYISMKKKIEFSKKTRESLYNFYYGFERQENPERLIKDDKIIFIDKEDIMTNNFFFWKFGKWALSCNESFLSLKKSIYNSEIIYILDKVEKFVSEHDFEKKNVILLGSNCDGYPYNYNSIFQIGVMSNRNPTIKILTILTWIRHINIDLRSSHLNCLQNIVPFTKDKNVLEIKTHLDCFFSKKELECNTHQLVNIVDFMNYIRFPGTFNLLLYHISLPLENKYKIKEFINKCSLLDPPKILFLNQSKILRLSEFMEIFSKSDLKFTHRIKSVDFYGVSDPIRGYSIYLERITNK